MSFGNNFVKLSIGFVKFVTYFVIFLSIFLKIFIYVMFQQIMSNRFPNLCHFLFLYMSPRHNYVIGQMVCQKSDIYVKMTHIYVKPCHILMSHLKIFVTHVS